MEKLLGLAVMQEIDGWQVEVLTVPGEGGPPGAEVEVRLVDPVDL